MPVTCTLADKDTVYEEGGGGLSACFFITKPCARRIVHPSPVTIMFMHVED